MKDNKGFSLIELLIVVAVIGIIAAIAVPNLMQSRLAANEGSAIMSVRNIVTGQITYASTIGAGSYAADLTELSNAGIIDSALGSGTKDGYNFGTAGAGDTFTVTAAPVNQGQSGKRGFYSDETAVIFYTTDGSTAGGVALGN